MNSKVELVRAFFDQPELYLNTDFNLRIRADVIKGFVGNALCEAILDIGCGNGAISLPLLRSDNHLTLLDLSMSMLSIANERIPPALSGNVTIVNENFIHAELPPQSYDLIICLGVLAHVDAPFDCIAKIASLSKSGGMVIVQNTDARHPYGYASNLYSSFQSRFLGRAYALNHLGNDQIIDKFQAYGMSLESLYRYNLPLPGMGRIVSSNRLYELTRKIYGTYKDNHFSWAGSECIMCFKMR